MPTIVGKFGLPIDEMEGDRLSLLVPRGAQFMHLGVQGNSMKLWAMLDPDAKPVRQWFQIMGTGFDFKQAGPFLGTAFLNGGGLVLHVFYAGPAGKQLLQVNGEWRVYPSGSVDRATTDWHPPSADPDYLVRVS